ncbi:hypothetical protein STXM2123_3533 [Streptomyces sp. F-3]|nr:hypothetical protein STXM2123_3533 [Streptomyces sp. F-3]
MPGAPAAGPRGEAARTRISSVPHDGLAPFAGPVGPCARGGGSLPPPSESKVGAGQVGLVVLPGEVPPPWLLLPDSVPSALRRTAGPYNNPGFSGAGIRVYVPPEGAEPMAAEC